RIAKTPTTTCASRHAIVVNGSGRGGGYAKSIAPSGCTVQQSFTGCQKYSSSVSPSRRGRSCVRQWKSSWSASWVVMSMGSTLPSIADSFCPLIVGGLERGGDDGSGAAASGAAAVAAGLERRGARRAAGHHHPQRPPRRRAAARAGLSRARQQG